MFLISCVAGALTSGCADHGVRTDRPTGGHGPPRTVVKVDGPWGQGTGWVLNAQHGLIATAYHVVNGARTVQVDSPYLRPKAQAARVISAAPCDDVAILRVSSQRGLRTLTGIIGARRGMRVTTLGWESLDRHSRWRVYSGTVESSASLPKAHLSREQPALRHLVATTATVEPGMSGGPLINNRGWLVGMTVAGPTQDGSSLALSVRHIIDTLLAFRRGQGAGWIGDGLIFTPDNAAYHGVVVVGLDHALGVYDNDGVLVTRVNGRPVGNSLASWCKAVSDIRPGLAKLTVVSELRGPSRTIRRPLNVAAAPF